MAKYVIEDTTLTNTANAIREKTGGTEPITPSNFATEIASIQSGGGDTTQEDGLIIKTLTEYSNDRVTTIGNYAFYEQTNLKTINIPNVTKIGKSAFSFTDITNIDLPLVTYIGDSAFSNSRLQNINIPLVKELGSSAFSSASLTNIDLPLVTRIEAYSFLNCLALGPVIDLPLVTYIGASAFSSCYALEKLILRSEIICTLYNKNALDNTPISSGTGYIYVLDNLVESYKSATNWSKYANQIKSISELEAN